jgi:hypothetical protein
VIEGKVARVLDSRTLAINRGMEDGVYVGMFFEVLDTAGTDIRDPDTGKPLGSVLRPKVRVRVTEAQQHLSIATTYRTFRRNVGGHGPDINPFMRSITPPRWIKERETFKSVDAAWEEITEEESFVKTGDPVRQVIETDEVAPEGKEES